MIERMRDASNANALIIDRLSCGPSLTWTRQHNAKPTSPQPKRGIAADITPRSQGMALQSALYQNQFIGSDHLQMSYRTSFCRNFIRLINKLSAVAIRVAETAIAQGLAGPSGKVCDSNISRNIR